MIKTSPLFFHISKINQKIKKQLKIDIIKNGKGQFYVPYIEYIFDLIYYILLAASPEPGSGQCFVPYNKG